MPASLENGAGAFFSAGQARPPVQERIKKTLPITFLTKKTFFCKIKHKEIASTSKLRRPDAAGGGHAEGKSEVSV